MWGLKAVATSGDTGNETRRARWLDRIALGITYVISPPVLPPLLIWLVLRSIEASAIETLLVVAGAAILLSIVPFIFVFWMVRSGRAQSLNLEDRRHRTYAMAIMVVGGLSLIMLIAATSGARLALVTAIVGAYILTTLILMAINHRWRISLHAASIAGCAAVLLFAGSAVASPVQGDPAGLHVLALMAALGIPVVAWARLRLRAHSASQVVVGSIIGFAIPYALLVLLESFYPFAT